MLSFSLWMPARGRCVAAAAYRVGAAWCLLAALLALWDVQGRWIEPGRAAVVWFKLWLFWAAWALLPWLLGWLLELRQAVGLRGRYLLGLVVLVVAAWGALVEPRLLVVRTHPLALPAGSPPLRLALVADLLWACLCGLGSWSVWSMCSMPKRSMPWWWPVTGLMTHYWMCKPP